MKLPHYRFLEVYQDFKKSLDVDLLLEKQNPEIKAKYPYNIRLLGLLRDFFNAKKELRLLYDQEPRCFQIMMIAKTQFGDHLIIGIETQVSHISKWHKYKIEDPLLKVDTILKFPYEHQLVPKENLQLIDQQEILIGEFKLEFDKK